ncbi:MAG: ABC transporter ATP-binding protein [Verrucomicrobia bacterium]|nr:ABC transporter ATP-binding protein [Verrucomicrobiota bacterium]
MRLWDKILKPAASEAAPPTPSAGPKSAAGEPHPGLAVEIADLGKSYQNFWALRHVTFSVRKGECVGIVGFNGAGKSTLLQIIAGSLTPTEGVARTHGRVVPLLELGSSLNGDLSGRENLYLAAALMGVTRTTLDQQMNEIEAFAEIGPFMDKPVRTYSSGMVMRLAFSLLTQVEPDIMIIDEALAVGDAYFAHKCMRMIRRFREQGRSLLFVSHDPSAIKTFCDRAILLDKGVMLQDGPPEQVLDYYNALIAAQESRFDIQQSTSSSGRTLTRSGNGQAQITRFDLLDANDKPVRAVLCGSQVKICCVVECIAEVEEPTVGFLIRDRLGNDVFGTNTFNLRTSVGHYTAGHTFETSFNVRLNLGPGHYSITLAVHTGADHLASNFDWRDNLLAFVVVPNWPFVFGGVAALEATAGVSQNLLHLHSRYGWGDAISFTSEGQAQRYQIAGWQSPEADGCWTSGTKARLGLQLPEARSASLEAHVTPFTHGDLLQQRLELWVGDRKLAEWQLRQPQVIRAQLPAAGIDPARELQLTWLLPDACSPASLQGSADERVIAVKFHRLTITT